MVVNQAFLPLGRTMDSFTTDAAVGVLWFLSNRDPQNKARKTQYMVVFRLVSLKTTKQKQGTPRPTNIAPDMGSP